MLLRRVTDQLVVLFVLTSLAVGCNAEQPKSDRSSPTQSPPPCPDTLMKAVVQGSATCVERILAAKPIDPATGEGFEPASPLVIAAALGHARIVELLLPSHTAHANRAVVVAAGGRPNASSPDTVALLFKQTLTEYGGVPTKNLALGVALLRCQDDVVESLKATGLSSIPSGFEVSMNNPMHHVDQQLYELGIADPWLAAERGDMQRLQDSLPESPGVNVATRCGDTPLINASRSNQLAAVEYLLRRGADGNLRNKRGESALTLAAKHPEIVRALQQAGAKK